MSRVGKVPVKIPDGVEVKVDQFSVVITGPLGVLKKDFRGFVKISIDSGFILVSPLDDSKKSRMMWGTVRSILNWMIIGVTVGFSKELEIIGVGYRVSMIGKYMNLSLGKSHETKVVIPEQVKVKVQSQTSVILSSHDKELLGTIVSLIISQRPPEPYKGKGIKFKGMYVERKEGKKG